jgi:hypothetical protein
MLVGFALAACVQSHASTCGNLICPMGTSCGPSGDTCVYSDLLEACSGLTDGMPCTVPGLPSNQCIAGVCQASSCGDGRITGAEECEGTSLAGKTCQSFGFYNPDGLACHDCKFDKTRCTGTCGDGIKNGPEQCDPGNPVTAAPADLGKATCLTAGYYKPDGPLACKPDCTFDTTKCQGGRCGDGIINGPEQCDGTTLLTMPSGKPADCTGLGFQGATTSLKCSKTCRYTATSCACTTAGRCPAKTHRCECSKTGPCGCVAIQSTK